MNLEQYFKKYEINVSAFAKACDLHRGTLYNVLNGKRKISLQVAEKIYRQTNGEVTYNDLLNTKPKISTQKKDNHKKKNPKIR